MKDKDLGKQLSAEPRSAPRSEPAAPRVGETYEIVGGSSVIWGTQDSITAPAASMGTLIAFDTDEDAKFEPVENEQGAVTGIVIYDTETVLKITVVASSTATLPAMGDPLTIGAVSGTVLKTARRAQNKSTVKFEVEAHKWAHLTLS